MGLAVGIGAGYVGGDDAAIGDHEASDHGPFSEMNALVSVSKSDQGAADLRSRRVAVSVEYARERVRAFASAEELAAIPIRSPVEGRSPLNQFGDTRWALGYQRLGGGAVNDSIAGVYGVFKVEGHVFGALHGDGDAALRVVGIRLGQRLLGDDQHLSVTSQLHGRTKPCDTRTHDQKIHFRRQCHNL
jgi:hypothetical protein